MKTHPIADAARLEVEGWLDAVGIRDEEALARDVHAGLMTTAFAHEDEDVRDRVICEVNARAHALLAMALRAAAVLQDPAVVHETVIPADDESEAEIFTGTFVDIHSIDPQSSLQALTCVRSEKPSKQIAALELLKAHREALRASDAVGIASLDEDDLSSFWPEDEIAPPRKLVVGRVEFDEAKPSIDVVRTRALRRLNAVEKAVSKLATAVPETLHRASVEVVESLQAQGIDDPPLAVVLPHDLKPEHCARIARGYDTLAWSLWHSSSQIRGSMRQLAIEARQTLQSFRSALRVMAGWIRALGHTHGSPRCEFCYRHRATKKRCVVHAVKQYITKEARVAAAMHPLYVERFATLAKQPGIRRALEHGLMVSAAEIAGIQREIQQREVPEVLQMQVATLVIQLRRIRPVLNAVLDGEVALLFQTLLDLAVNVHRRPPGQTATERRAHARAMDDCEAVLTLRGFMTVWCATGRPFPDRLPVHGENHDPAHPIIRDQPLLESEIVLGFLRERAWRDAEREFRQRTEISHKDVMALRDQGMSFDAIALRFGCSHDTIVRMVTNANTSRKRGRLKKYAAASRLKR